jgi:cyanophycinase
MNAAQTVLTLMIVGFFALIRPGETHAHSQEAQGVGRPTTASVLLIGGGKTPVAAVRAFIKAAGGSEARIVVLAQTEENAREGAPLSAAQFREQGATSVEAPVDLPVAQVLALLEQARGVWIPGGDQNRFMTAFPESSGVPAAIRAVYRRGGVVGGTSAGASLLGDLMPTGAKSDSADLQEGGCPVQAALRVLPDTIIDQHFLVRNRLPRLLTAVLEHPRCRGIGLDEGAWATLKNNILKVGQGQVILLQVVKPVRHQGKLLGTAGMTLKVLLPDEEITLVP